MGYAFDLYMSIYGTYKSHMSLYYILESITPIPATREYIFISFKTLKKQNKVSIFISTNYTQTFLFLRTVLKSDTLKRKIQS